MRRTVANAAILAASLLFALLVLELGLRLVQGVSPWRFDNFILVQADRFGRRVEQTYDPRLGWTYKPGLLAVRTLTEPALTTGEFGVRLNQADLQPVPRNAILTVGDSFTFGAEVADADSWPAALERMLGVPVVNAGVGGYGTDQIILRAETLIPELQPTTIVVSFLDGDILRSRQSVFHGASKPYFEARGSDLVAFNVPVPLPGTRPSPSLDPLRAVVGYSYLVDWVMARLGQQSWFEVSKSVEAEGVDPVRVTCLLLERLKRRTDGSGIRLIFLMQWAGGEILLWDERPQYARDVLDCAVQAGIRTVDAWDSLKAAYAGDEGRIDALYHRTWNRLGHGHMSAAGNMLIAEIVADVLREELP